MKLWSEFESNNTHTTRVILYWQAPYCSVRLMMRMQMLDWQFLFHARQSFRRFSSIENVRL